MSVSTAASDQSVCTPLAVLGRDVTVPLVTGGEVTYAALDYAASAPALQRVWDDVAAYAPYYGSVHRGAGYLSQLSTDLFENARRTVADFLDCRAGDQVIFTRSTTDSPQPPRPRDPGRLPGLRLRDRAPRLPAALAGRPGHLPQRPAHPAAGRGDPGAGPRRPRPLRPGPGLRHRRLQRHRRAVAGARTGRRRAAHGARIVLDAAQLAPHHPVSVADLDVDWVAFSVPQGCCAPPGSGVLAGRCRLAAGRRAVPRGRRRQPARSPGARTAAWPSSGTRPLARHEAGSPNVIGAYAIASACKALTEAGLGHPGRPRTAPRPHGPRGLAEVPEVRILSLFGDDAPGSASPPSSSRAGTAPTSPPPSPPSTASASATASSAPTPWSAPCSAATRRPRASAVPPEAAPGEKSLNAIRVSFGAGTPDEHVRALRRRGEGTGGRGREVAVPHRRRAAASRPSEAGVGGGVLRGRGPHAPYLRIRRRPVWPTGPAAPHTLPPATARPGSTECTRCAPPIRARQRHRTTSRTDSGPAAWARSTSPAPVPACAWR